jgi:hypothetical protein
MHHRPTGRRPRPSPSPVLAAVGLIVLTMLAGCVSSTASSTVSSATLSAAPSAAPSATLSPSPSPAASAAPSASPSTAGAARCAATDVGVVGGPWEAAAGSRGAAVTVTNRASTACLLPVGPIVAMYDAAARALLDSPAATGEPVSFEPAATTSFTVLLSNWCDTTAPLPIHVALRLEGGDVDITGLDLSADDLPPCNGPGQPLVITVSEWGTR